MTNAKKLTVKKEDETVNEESGAKEEAVNTNAEEKTNVEKAEERDHISVVNAPGTAPMPILAMEMKDQVMQRIAVGSSEDSLLMRERRDHLNTLNEAMDKTPKNDVSDEDKRTAAEDRVKEISKTSELDADRLAAAERVPSNWAIEPGENGNIKATNRVTGKVYEGPAKTFLKS